MRKFFFIALLVVAAVFLICRAPDASAGGVVDNFMETVSNLLFPDTGGSDSGSGGEGCDVGPAQTIPAIGLNQGGFNLVTATNLGNLMDFSFSENSDKKNMVFFIPGYAYFQGVVYTTGSFKAVGHVRVIGGIISSNNISPGTIYIQNGAVLTSCPEYLSSYITGGRNSLVITKWEEISPAP